MVNWLCSNNTLRGPPSVLSGLSMTSPTEQLLMWTLFQEHIAVMHSQLQTLAACLNAQPAPVPPAPPVAICLILHLEQLKLIHLRLSGGLLCFPQWTNGCSHLILHYFILTLRTSPFNQPPVCPLPTSRSLMLLLLPPSDQILFLSPELSLFACSGIGPTILPST